MQTTEIVNAEEHISPECRKLIADKAYLLKLRNELDNVGFACIQGFLTKEGLELLQKQVLEIETLSLPSNEGKNRKYSVKSTTLEGSVIARLATAEPILGLINELLGDFEGEAKSIITEPINSDEVVPGLNIMRGPGDVTAFHFDGTFLNILVPVFIPKLAGPNRGQLTIYPNIRSFKKNWLDRWVVPILCRTGIFKAIYSRREIDYQVGNVYLFYGYRSLHGVESPCESGLRCTTNITVGAKRFT